MDSYEEVKLTWQCGNIYPSLDDRSPNTWKTGSSIQVWSTIVGKCFDAKDLHNNTESKGLFSKGVQ